MKSPGMFFVILLLASIISTTQVLTLETSYAKVQSVANASAIPR